MEESILKINSKKEEKFLREKTKKVSFGEKGEPVFGGKSRSRKEVYDLISRMRKTMKTANGIGLSANQIGLDFQLFVAEVPGSQGQSKFYAIFNPEIEKTGKEKVAGEEGCLSVPGSYGEVPRFSYVILKGTDKNGKTVKIKAWGLLARVFQHEVDHLNGKLFLDSATKVEKITEKES